MLVTASHLADDGRAAALVVPPVDVLLACLLLRFLACRSALGLSGVLALVTVVYDLLAASGGQRVAAPGDPVVVLWVLAACLFVLAALHPSMTAAFDARTLLALGVDQGQGHHCARPGPAMDVVALLAVTTPAGA